MPRHYLDIILVTVSPSALPPLSDWWCCRCVLTEILKGLFVRQGLYIALAALQCSTVQTELASNSRRPASLCLLSTDKGMSRKAIFACDL